MKATSLVLLLASILTGCGYFTAGEWNDDPQNWRRAFHEDPPAGLLIHHSYYWRSPHFTNEWQYFFEVEDSKTARQALGLYGPVTMDRSQFDERRLPSDRPEWFLKPIPENVTVWGSTDHPDRCVVLNPSSGRLFAFDQQL